MMINRNMAILVNLSLILSLSGCSSNADADAPGEGIENTCVQISPGITANHQSVEWQKALTGRMSEAAIDSVSSIVRPLTKDEIDWMKLIESRANRWNSFRDSLGVPFSSISLSDTIRVLIGYQGGDDGFTYQDKTICLDVTAMANAYGSANDSVNEDRIDRLFAHEYTHLLHKAWARKNGMTLVDFRDSILWECMYEGFGMYRSMSQKWQPTGDSLSPHSRKTMTDLYPKFTEKIITVLTRKNLTRDEKNALHKNLSRGSMTQKWGALPVAIWLAHEAKGNDENLVKWVEKGPEAVLELAQLYLPDENNASFKKGLQQAAYTGSGDLSQKAE